MSVKPANTEPSRAPTAEADDASGRTVSVTSLAMLVVVGVAVVEAAVFVARLQEAIGLTFAAVCLSLITLPIQRTLQRWIGTVGSLVTTAIGTLAAVITISYVVLRDLGTQSEVVAERVRERLDEVRPGSFADRVVEALQLDSAIDEWLNRVPSLVVIGREGGTEVGLQLLALVAVVILATFFQSSGRSIVDWFVARWPREIAVPNHHPNDPDAEPSPRARARAFFNDVERKGVGYMRRS